MPIHTPQRSIPVQPPANHLSLYQHALGINPNQLPTNPVQIHQTNNNFPIATRMAGPIVLNDEQLAKLKSELEIVNGNIKVFDEMLTELDNSKNLKNEDLELLHELNATCQQMQKRIVELLDRVSNEEITSELLTVNDNLNALFARYEVYSVKGTPSTPQTTNSALALVTAGSQTTTNNQPPTNVRPPVSAQRIQEEASLIDLRETNTSNLANQLDALHMGAVAHSPQLPQTQPNKLTTARPQPSQAGDKDFDEFAQSRNERQAPRMIDGIELPNDQEAR